jgi:hypothetical protein
VYERFTDRARKVFQLANWEAQKLNHEYIGTEHLLLGLIKEGSGVASRVLVNMGLFLCDIREAVLKIVQPGPDIVTMGKLPQTPVVKQVVEYAIAEARNMAMNYIGTEHILLGLLRVEQGVAYQVLTKIVDVRSVRDEVKRLLGRPVEGKDGILHEAHVSDVVKVAEGFASWAVPFPMMVMKYHGEPSPLAQEILAMQEKMGIQPPLSGNEDCDAIGDVEVNEAGIVGAGLVMNDGRYSLRVEIGCGLSFDNSCAVNIDGDKVKIDGQLPPDVHVGPGLVLIGGPGPDDVRVIELDTEHYHIVPKQFLECPGVPIIINEGLLAMGQRQYTSSEDRAIVVDGPRSSKTQLHEDIQKAIDLTNPEDIEKTVKDIDSLVKMEHEFKERARCVAVVRKLMDEEKVKGNTREAVILLRAAKEIEKHPMSWLNEGNTSCKGS